MLIRIGLRLSLLLGLLGCASTLSGPIVAVAPDDLTPRPLLRAGAQPSAFFPQQFLLANRLAVLPPLGAGETLFIPLPGHSLQFYWPLIGEVRTAAALHGVEISAPQGAVVRAARQGQVAVAAQALAGRGPTLVLTHEEGYTSVYAGVATLLVAPGAQVVQGSPIARLGSQPLHFEIRREAAPVPMLSLLPSDE